MDSIVWVRCASDSVSSLGKDYHSFSFTFFDVYGFSLSSIGLKTAVVVFIVSKVLFAIANLVDVNKIIRNEHS